MGIGKKQNWNYLDGEYCARLWAELGSLTKVSKRLVSEGKYNPETNEPPTPAGIRVAVRRWQAENYEEGRQFMISIGETWAENEDEYNKWLVAQARGSLGNQAFNHFLKRNDLEQYRQVQYQ